MAHAIYDYFPFKVYMVQEIEAHRGFTGALVIAVAYRLDFGTVHCFETAWEDVGVHGRTAHFRAFKGNSCRTDSVCLCSFWLTVSVLLLPLGHIFWLLLICLSEGKLYKARIIAIGRTGESAILG